MWWEEGKHQPVVCYLQGAWEDAPGYDRDRELQEEVVWGEGERKPRVPTGYVESESLAMAFMRQYPGDSKGRNGPKQEKSRP